MLHNLHNYDEITKKLDTGIILEDYSITYHNLAFLGFGYYINVPHGCAG